MSGIAGILNLHRRSYLDASTVAEMCCCLRDSGTGNEYFKTLTGIVLAQTGSRTSPSLKNQAGLIEVSGISVALDGSIHNNAELRKELVSSGHVFATETDAELIAHLYQEAGINFLSKLNGMYAFALWDNSRQSLFLVRDRLGIKPLYYSQILGAVAFASEMKALLVVENISGEPDLIGISEYLLLGYIPAPHTPVAHIRKLRPGTYIEFSDGHCFEKTYWNPTTETGSSRPLGEQCEELRSLVHDAVRLRMMPGEPVGVFASGGLGSALVMWGIARERANASALFVDFENLSIDGPYARLASSWTGIPIRHHYVCCQEPVTLLTELIWQLDEPMATPAALGFYLAALEGSVQSNAFLHGSGGDQVFACNHSWSGSLLSRDWIASKRLLGRNVAARLTLHQHRLNANPLFDEQEVTRGLGLNGWHAHNILEESCPEADGDDVCAAMAVVNSRLCLPAHAVLIERVTTAASLEVRLPLLDHRIVEFAARLPFEMKRRGDNDNWLVRRAFQSEIPTEILDRARQECGPPLREWMRRGIARLASELLSGSDTRIKAVISPRHLSAILAGKNQHSDRSAARLWALVVLELWWRVVLERKQLSDVALERSRVVGGGQWI